MYAVLEFGLRLGQLDLLWAVATLLWACGDGWFGRAGCGLERLEVVGVRRLLSRMGLPGHTGECMLSLRMVFLQCLWC